MFDWNDARHFLSISRTGTLSAAARALGVNQSTVGRRLDALEDALGCRLFLRTRDGLILSPAGEQLLPRAERIEEEADAISRELAGAAERLVGTLRVTMPDGFGPYVVAPLLADFQRAHPGIELEVDADNRLRSLTKREADLSLRLARPMEPQLVTRRVVAFGQAPYCAPSYIAAWGRPRAPFAGHRFVGDVHDELPETRWVLSRAAHGHVVARSGSTHAQLALAVAGAGIALLPCYLGDEHPGLVRLGPPEASVERAVWLVMHRDLQHAARVRACADFLAERIAAQAPRITGTAARKRAPRR